MTGQTNVAPTIIKRKKVIAGNGHHGGAWKVAYADFVTAMMAFFMMMWLLSATTETQRHGLADYFSPSIPLSRQSAGSDGVLSGPTAFPVEVVSEIGVGAIDTFLTDQKQMLDDGLQRVKDALEKLSDDTADLEGIMRHVAFRVTDEGLVVELFDLETASLFEPDSARPTQLLRDLTGVIQGAAELVTHPMAVEGHVTSEPIVQIENPVWSLSAHRADEVRLLFDQAGLSHDRIRRVTGHADREPAVPDPMAVRNNRIEVIFLHQ